MDIIHVSSLADRIASNHRTTRTEQPGGVAGGAAFVMMEASEPNVCIICLLGRKSELPAGCKTGEPAG